MKLGKRYSAAREALGLTSGQLAAELGLARITVSRRENDHQRITREMVLALESLASRLGRKKIITSIFEP